MYNLQLVTHEMFELTPISHFNVRLIFAIYFEF